MTMPTGSWVSLFSGGKDSSWALHRAVESGLDVAHLLTVHPPPSSYLYHVPATELTPLAAESIGLPLREIDAGSVGGPSTDRAGEAGDRELVPLEAALRSMADRMDLAGVITGAVESDFQRDRLGAMCDRLGLALYAPLWERDHLQLARTMLEAGFDVRFVAVAAEGLDASWLGRRWTEAALDDLRRLNDRHGVHLLGEGGEFETLVVDGPHMNRRIAFEADVSWDGTRGQLVINEAWLV